MVEGWLGKLKETSKWEVRTKYDVCWNLRVPGDLDRPNLWPVKPLRLIAINHSHPVIDRFLCRAYIKPRSCRDSALGTPHQT